MTTLAAEDRTSVFAIPNYRWFWITKLASTMSQMILVIVIGWMVYDTARETMSERDSAFLLGMVGLAQFLPLFFLSLAVGYIADRVDRRHIVRGAIALEMLCAASLGALELTGGISIPALFVVAALLGVGRAFASPALSALAPNLVPTRMLPTAIAWNSIGWQVGAIGGPALGGYLYAANAAAPLVASATMLTISLVAMFLITPVPLPKGETANPLQSVMNGLRYVRDNKIVLGAISLDLFAVLLGGVTALLPVYARDILAVGPEGLGHLRAAPAVGAALVALWLSRRPLARLVGIKMFVCVGIFGAAIVVFGLSRDLWLSLAALGVLGAADMVSVYVRSSLIQIYTPDAMRGRVSSVSMLFVSASNELGEARSGLTAAWFGPVEAVVIGGIGTLVVTVLWAWRFPELRRADSFDVQSDVQSDVPGALKERST
jgi:MFS family permease